MPAWDEIGKPAEDSRAMSPTGHQRGGLMHTSMHVAARSPWRLGSEMLSARVVRSLRGLPFGVVVASGLVACTARHDVPITPTDREAWLQRAERYAHMTFDRKLELLQQVAADLPAGSAVRSEVLMRLADLLVDEAQERRTRVDETEHACGPDAVSLPNEEVVALCQRALAIIEAARAELPEDSPSRAEVEWRAARASRMLALSSETREALLFVIKQHPDSPLVPEALLAFGDTLWVFGGDEYKMCEAYRRASERDEAWIRPYALLQLGRCSLAYSDINGAFRAFTAATAAEAAATPLHWSCADLRQAAISEIDRLAEEGHVFRPDVE